jgi:LCP family protein required for cell wall assembly
MLGAAVAVLVLAATGTGWAGYRNLTRGVTVSQALMGGPTSSAGDQNILIMGLDSRLDEHGQPLPPEIYDALHAGDETIGGHNANVLIVLHLPGDGGPITAISIPRDDYVTLAGCPGGTCRGKIKQAYGFAYHTALGLHGVGRSVSSGGQIRWAASESGGPLADPIDPTPEQMAREAGRKAEIDTVRRVLGIPIDHFVEVTMVAFFEVTQVVQPITVCLRADTADPYSGADFHEGVQQIDATQAMAFVRQRRDVNDELFTDLDRTRRQQAFIASLVNALRHGGALSSPTALTDLLQVARDNIAVDAGFDLADFAEHAAQSTDRAVSLYTLPISQFGQDPAGEDVNLIDGPTIHAIVHTLVSSSAATPVPTRSPSPTQPTPMILNVRNASGHSGLATSLEQSFVTRGFTAGAATTAERAADTSTIDYGPGARDAAQALADQLQLNARASDTLSPNTVQLTVGADFPAGDYLSATTPTTAAAPATVVTTVAATATAAPEPTNLSRMSATDIPCVK